MPLAGSAGLLNWSDVGAADRPDYYVWHAREHMVGRIGVFGFLRGRRYAALHANCDFFQFYELADAAVLRSAPYLALANAPSALTQRVTQTIRNSCRMVARQVLSIGTGQAGCLLTLRFDDAEQVDAYLTPDLAARIRALPLVAGVHVFAAPEAPRRAVFIEGLSAEALEHAGDVLQSALGEPTGQVQRDLFRHEFTVTPDDAMIDPEEFR
jgi:hypothetical protein